MRDYKKLKVWKKAHQLTLIVYAEVLPAFPNHETFNLSNQTKRSAYSIPLNIVEGSGKNTEKDFAHYLDNALGSAHELEYCCLLAKDLNYLNEKLFNKLNSEANRLKLCLLGF
jgi:four helix bundle protein